MTNILGAPPGAFVWAALVLGAAILAGIATAVVGTLAGSRAYPSSAQRRVPPAWRVFIEDPKHGFLLQNIARMTHYLHRKRNGVG